MTSGSKEGKNEGAPGCPWLWDHVGAARKEQQSQEPPGGWPAGSADDFQGGGHSYMSDVGGRNDILSPERLLKCKEGEMASKEQVTSIYNTLTTGAG